MNRLGHASKACVMSPCREEATSAQKAVHERLVFELFGIHQKIRDNFSRGSDVRPRGKRRKNDNPILHVTPLRFGTALILTTAELLVCLSSLLRLDYSLRLLCSETHAHARDMQCMAGILDGLSQRTSLFLAFCGGCQSFVMASVEALCSAIVGLAMHCESIALKQVNKCPILCLQGAAQGHAGVKQGGGGGDAAVVGAADRE